MVGSGEKEGRSREQRRGRQRKVRKWWRGMHCMHTPTQYAQATTRWLTWCWAPSLIPSSMGWCLPNCWIGVAYWRGGARVRREKKVGVNRQFHASCWCTTSTTAHISCIRSTGWHAVCSHCTLANIRSIVSRMHLQHYLQAHYSTSRHILCTTLYTKLHYNILDIILYTIHYIHYALYTIQNTPFTIHYI